MEENLSPRTIQSEATAWQELEALNDLLADSLLADSLLADSPLADSLPAGRDELQDACRRALRFILDALQRPAGFVLVQTPAELRPWLVVACGLAEPWERQLDEPDSPLRREIEAMLHDNLEKSVPLASPLTAVVPLDTPGGRQGVLALVSDRTEAGSPEWEPFCAPADLERLNRLARPLARAVRQLRQRGPTNGVQAQPASEASQAELSRLRRTFDALFDSLPAAVYLIDQDYSLNAINAVGALRTGLPPQALVGQLCYTALYGRRAPCPGCQVAETLLNGNPTQRSDRRWGANDETTEWQIATYPVRDERWQVLQVIVLEQDLTEQRRLESVLVQSEKLAAVGQLAAGVAHEINNPLTAIIANAQILQRELRPEDDLQESVDLIARAGARATQVVRSLLDIARKDEMHMARTDVNETLLRALALVQHELLARSITLQFEPTPNLPPIWASQDQLQGVWLNLLLNAVDAMAVENSADAENGSGDNRAGEIRPTVLRVSTRLEDGEILAVVEDSGKGIAPDRLQRIFEPFYTTKAPGRGTGLGLSVSERIVKQHGGRIQVESRVDAGSRFTVYLPVKN